MAAGSKCRAGEVFVAVVVVLVGAVACGDSGPTTEELLQERLRADALAEGREPSGESVECAATAVLNVVGEDAVAPALEAGGEAFDELMAEELSNPAAEVGFFDEMSRCSTGYAGFDDLQSEGGAPTTDGAAVPPEASADATAP